MASDVLQLIDNSDPPRWTITPNETNTTYRIDAPRTFYDNRGDSDELSSYTSITVVTAGSARKAARQAREDMKRHVRGRQKKIMLTTGDDILDKAPFRAVTIPLWSLAPAAFVVVILVLIDAFGGTDLTMTAGTYLADLSPWTWLAVWLGSVVTLGGIFSHRRVSEDFDATTRDLGTGHGVSITHNGEMGDIHLFDRLTDADRRILLKHHANKDSHSEAGTAYRMVLLRYRHPNISEFQLRKLAHKGVPAERASWASHAHNAEQAPALSRMRYLGETHTEEEESVQQRLNAQRARNAELRRHYRGVWTTTTQRHKQLMLDYLDLELSVEKILTMPAITDVTNPHTAAMIDAMTTLERTPQDLPSYLREDVDQDTPVLDVEKEPYLQRVHEFDTAMTNAIIQARRIGLEYIPADERRMIERIIKLLNLAGGSTTTAERALSYEQAFGLIDQLRHVHIPESARGELEAHARRELTT